MRTIDEIRIEGDEDGWHLVIHLDDAATYTHYRCAHDHEWSAQTGQHSLTCPVCGTITFTFTHVGPVLYRIGLPDQFKAEVDKTIGAWLAEGELVKAVMRASADGYDKDDPKHPMWLEQIHARVDMDAVEDLERIARESSD